MRILITGATGQLGKALTCRLQTCGLVITADRSIIDLSRPDTISRSLDVLRPDIIINTAAYTAVNKAEDEPELAMLVNARAPGMIARWAAQHGAALLHFSTDYVFNGDGEWRWTEEDSPRPLSVYGASKLAGEDEVRAAGGLSLVLRTSWVYASTGRNFLNTIAALARERTELRVVADQVGAPTTAASLADAVATALEGKNTVSEFEAPFGAARGLVHISATGEASWHEFASAIVDGLRTRGVSLAVTRLLPISTREFASRAQRPLNSRLDLGRLQRVFGITMPHWYSALDTELDRVANKIEHFTRPTREWSPP
jgi:dTDP-4-dehydrorhamnose reductase